MNPKLVAQAKENLTQAEELYAKKMYTDAFYKYQQAFHTGIAEHGWGILEYGHYYRLIAEIVDTKAPTQQRIKNKNRLLTLPETFVPFEILENSEKRASSYTTHHNCPTPAQLN